MTVECLRLILVEPCAHLWINYCDLGSGAFGLASLLGHSYASTLPAIVELGALVGALLCGVGT